MIIVRGSFPADPGDRFMSIIAFLSAERNLIPHGFDLLPLCRQGGVHPPLFRIFLILGKHFPTFPQKYMFHSPSLLPCIYSSHNARTGRLCLHTTHEWSISKSPSFAIAHCHRLILGGQWSSY